MQGRPNTVFILMDNLGYGELGAYGGGIIRGAATPRVDRLADEGTRLTNYNVEAQCTPSRSAILTARFSIRSGTHSVPIGGGIEGLTPSANGILAASTAASRTSRVSTNGTEFPVPPTRRSGRMSRRPSH
ncbi:sulfatase-like hydrolase/transferase [Rhizobium leguminosarum]